jgi:hypothetical protein
MCGCRSELEQVAQRAEAAAVQDDLRGPRHPGIGKRPPSPTPLYLTAVRRIPVGTPDVIWSTEYLQCMDLHSVSM